MIIGDEWGNELNDKARMATTLSSKYDAHSYTQPVAAFPVSVFYLFSCKKKRKIVQSLQ